MSHLTSSQDKLQQLCEILQGQAIEPAKVEAHKLIERAREESAALIQEAKAQAASILESARQEVRKENEVAHASLKQAAAQAVGKLRQEIETGLVNAELAQVTHETLSKSDVVVSLLKKYIEMVQAKGWDKDFTLEISKLPEAKDLSAKIAFECVGKLKEGKVLQVLSEGGFRLKLHDKRMTIDASESALVELLGQFLRKELRTRLFM